MIKWPSVVRLRSPWITALCFGRPVETESFLMPFQQMLLKPALKETSTRYEELNQLSGFEPAFPPQLAARTSEPLPVTRRPPRKHKLDKL